MKHRMTRRWLAGGVTIVAVGFPSAAAARFDIGAPPAPGGTQAQSAPSLPVQHTGPSAQAGFQWGDAGIGAAGAVILLAAGTSTSTIGRRRRGHRAAG